MFNGEKVVTSLTLKTLVVHFSVRKLEIMMAGLFIHLSLSYESNWSKVLLLIGLARVIVLFLNGVHLKFSAELRMVLATSSFIVLAVLVGGFNNLAALSSLNSVYFWLGIGELMNIWQASSDSIVRRAHRYGYN